MAISTVLAVIASLALFILWLTAVTNLFFFPRLAEGKPGTTPLVSILIPARNEGPTIGQTIASLRRQSYTDFELLVLDDESDDDTAAQVRRAAGDDGRCRLLSGQPLPAGWLGKNWACHQLAQAARGDYLLFSDADVHWRPEALDGLLALAEREQSDLLTIWPTQQTVTWSERLVVPLMALAILAYLPVLPVHHTRWRAFAAANGQCLLFRRAAYDRSGGHAAVRDDIVEDVTLARRVKAASGRLRMADGGGLISCRMYDGWPAVRDGFAKNILSGHGGPLLRWDTGPSVITMRHVFEELFAALPASDLADYLTLLPVEPLTRYFYPDGVVLDATRDLAAMAGQIAALEPRDVEGYLAYLAYAARLHRITGPVFIYDQPPTWRSFLRVPVQDWLKADGLRTMDGAIRHHVRSPHLRQLLGRFATYVGGSPTWPRPPSTSSPMWR
jgi:chlorobactene glucosyltransferase